MCGIAGIVGEHSIDELQTLSAALAHRGPDHQATLSLNQRTLGLVHNRLSIIDLSERAHQPMQNQTKTMALVFNGEIYNYKHLKNTALKNERFETQSDTEVVLKLVEKEGIGFLPKLSGMFAFALADLTKKTVFLVRDRYGIKPLYYAIDIKGRLVFASEAQALVKLQTIEKKLNLKAVSAFLQFGSVMGRETLFEGIYALEPGETLTYQNNIPQIKKWFLSPSNETKNVSTTQAHQMFDEGFTKAVERHLVSDVPVGLFLSGGLDSSLLLLKMKELGQQNINTFSVRFKARSGIEDEFGLAQRLSQKMKSHHHEVFLDEKNIEAPMEEFLRTMDQPSIDGFNTFFVSQAAAKHTKVVLSGLGGDEVLGGYPHYGYLKILSKCGLSEKQLKRFYEHQKTIFHFKSIEKVMLTKVEPNHVLSDFHFKTKNIDLNTSDLDFDVYLKNTLLKDSDVFSMRFGLELRVPFLDPEFVETVRGIHGHVFKMFGNKKQIVREIYKNQLPKEIIDKKKSGFVLPLGAWLQTSLKKSVEQKLSEKNINKYGVLNASEVQKVKDTHMHSKRPQQTFQKVWALVTLQNFLETHF